MRKSWRNTIRAASRFWRGVREWCGDAAYEKYATCAGRKEPSKLLTPAEFYVEQLDRKYSRPNRCC
jgi:uncharacterized short protein YbdD (DUF466 family)